MTLDIKWFATWMLLFLDLFFSLAYSFPWVTRHSCDFIWLYLAKMTDIIYRQNMQIHSWRKICYSQHSKHVLSMARYRNYSCLSEYFAAESHSSYFCDILWRRRLSAMHAQTLPKTFMFCVHHTQSVRIQSFPSLILSIWHCKNISVLMSKLVRQW